jgi:predicted nucleotidyltransferase component of viral defense system
MKLSSRTGGSTNQRLALNSYASLFVHTQNNKNKDPVHHHNIDPAHCLDR